APTSTLTFFGPKNYAPNYGWMFSGYGVGAIVAGLIAGNAKDVFGSYMYGFWVSGGLALVGIVLALAMMKKPAADSAREAEAALAVREAA
ncbi:MAG: hypothetical protein PHY92_10895, partial [Alphaproteobacteria bacterium]|nr:hypothetical protein [Alphaproteobacteria bacterium]